MSCSAGFEELNGDVLSAINDMMGRSIIVSTIDKKRYNGVLFAVSTDFVFGLQSAVEITEENEKDLLRKEANIIPKLSIHFEHIVDCAYNTEDDKKQTIVGKFATDRSYHGDVVDKEELEAWQDEDGGIGEAIEDEAVASGQQSSRRNIHNNGTGWSVNDMFAVNEKMNVVSTFKDDLTQYTTVEVVGTEEDRARADRLAREIESNSSSKFMANLENDDDERDLDKITRQEDFDNGNNQRGGKRNSNYNQQPQQRRNQNITTNGQPVNRRAEGLRGDRRNSGGSSANNSRYNAPAANQNYQQQQPQQQQQQQKGGNYNNRRQNEEYRDNDWQMAKGKSQNQGNDHSFRQQQKQMLDPRPKQQAEAEKSQGSGSRVTELKNWANEFSIAPPKENSPAPGSAPPAPQGNLGSAWNRGPPSSLVAKGSAPETVSPTTETAPAVVDKQAVSNQKKQETPSTSADAHNDTDVQQEDRDDVSVTDRSETSSVITSKSSSFKFNINAPEFKPRAAPATPTPTTPSGPVPPHINQVQPQSYIPQEYQQHPMIQQGPAMVAGMVQHVGPGGIPQNQGQVMWQPAQQGYAQNAQYQIPQVPMQGVPGQMYGAAATAPVTVNQQPTGANQQIPTSTSGPVDGRQNNPQQQQRRDGEYRAPQPMFFSPYPQEAAIVPVQQQYYNQAAYANVMPQQQYSMKPIPQPQGGYQQRFQPQYMVPQGRNPQGYQPPQSQQPHQFAGEQGTAQSHSNSQPTTPGPRGGEMNGQKNQQAPPQNGNNGMHRETEAGSNTSLSGSASSQSGQRSGSPQNTAAPPAPQQQQQVPPPPHQGPPHVGPPHAMMGVPQAQYMVYPHHQMQNYYPQQQVYYPMMVPQQMQMQQNQHGQQSLMGERADTGYAHNNYFDFRTMPNYQQNQQQHQPIHGGHLGRQNSIPQQFSGNQVLKV